MNDHIKNAHNAIAGLQAFYSSALREMRDEDEKMRTLNTSLAQQLAKVTLESTALKATCATLEEKLQATGNLVRQLELEAESARKCEAQYRDEERTLTAHLDELKSMTERSRQLLRRETQSVLDDLEEALKGEGAWPGNVKDVMLRLRNLYG